MPQVTLDRFLETYAKPLGETAKDLSNLVLALAASAIKVRDLVNQGALAKAFAEETTNRNADGDVQKALDVAADEIFLAGLNGSSVAVYASEELDNPVLLNPSKSLALAIDPLDGSSNIDTNVSIGTIFSILPAGDNVGDNPNLPFMQAGHHQLGAGFFVYGPQLSLVLTLGDGVMIFVHSNRLNSFVLAYDNVTISKNAREYAVNASNSRHWRTGFRQYMDDCLAGEDGPLEQNYNMRWVASLVADTYRILIRGGVFYYPSDDRKGYHNGRLRLVYEANPVAFLIEQAGGSATDCFTRILDIRPKELHQRVPLAFGASNEIERVGRYCSETAQEAENAPLFNKRGLFRT
jgi:fructose-1,6-bisphosphatase I